mmetsp:Transcript_12798/g.25554  ORF Transcript_12798/g.25554 Transcript_12798/m.25554 type:complete len:253 (-) Transcript_12798:1053-1811(-)
MSSFTKRVAVDIIVTPSHDLPFLIGGTSGSIRTFPTFFQHFGKSDCGVPFSSLPLFCRSTSKIALTLFFLFDTKSSPFGIFSTPSIPLQISFSKDSLSPEFVFTESLTSSLLCSISKFTAFLGAPSLFFLFNAELTPSGIFSMLSIPLQISFSDDSLYPEFFFSESLTSSFLCFISKFTAFSGVFLKLFSASLLLVSKTLDVFPALSLTFSIESSNPVLFPTESSPISLSSSPHVYVSISVSMSASFQQVIL